MVTIRDGIRGSMSSPSLVGYGVVLVKAASEHKKTAGALSEAMLIARPALGAGVLGGAVGAGTGALAAGEGHRMEGARAGGIMGGVTGGLGGSALGASDLLQNRRLLRAGGKGFEAAKDVGAIPWGTLPPEELVNRLNVARRNSTDALTEALTPSDLELGLSGAGLVAGPAGALVAAPIAARMVANQSREAEKTANANDPLAPRAISAAPVDRDKYIREATSSGRFGGGISGAALGGVGGYALGSHLTGGSTAGRLVGGAAGAALGGVGGALGLGALARHSASNLSEPEMQAAEDYNLANELWLQGHISDTEMDHAQRMFDTSRLRKTAAPRWKQVLRAGGLEADDVSRLTGSGVLDYGKEIAGLERGTNRLADIHGVTQHEGSVRGVLGGVLDAIRGRGTDSLSSNAQALYFGRKGGGYFTLPGLNSTYALPGSSPLLQGTRGATRQGLDALARRHEIDEMIAARGAKHHFVPGRDPVGLKERLLSRSIDAQRDLLSSMSDAARGRGAGSAADALDLGIGSAFPARRGALPAGRHFSPDVILRESRNVATLPPEVAEQMAKFRKGEMDTLSPLGFSYGRESAPDQRKAILSAFDRREI